MRERLLSLFVSVMVKNYLRDVLRDLRYCERQEMLRLAREMHCCIYIELLRVIYAMNSSL